MLVTDDAETSWFHLAGYLAAADGRDGFAVPVLRGSASNRLVTQSIGEDGNIDGFTVLPEAGAVRPFEDETIRIAKGSQALWAFVRADGTLHVLTKPRLVDLLGSLPTDGMAAFLRLQIAQFRGLDDKLPARWKASYAHLERSSPRSAAAWRDIVVVPPAVRAAVLETARDHGLAHLAKDLSRSVSVSLEGDRLEITLAGDLHDALAGKSSATQALRRRLRPLRLAFRLDHTMVLTSAAAKARSAEVRRLADVRMIVVGQRAANIARHALSDRRSANGSIRTFPLGDLVGETSVGWVEGGAIRPLTTAEVFDLETGGERPLVVLTTVDREDSASALLARDVAKRHRKEGSATVIVVLHLPDAVASDEEIELWRRLGMSCDALWAISDLSPHTRQSASYGGGRSAAAAAGRLIELLALAADDEFPIAARRGLTGSEVSVFGSAVGDVSPSGLLHHAAMRISTPSIRLEGADLAIAAVSDGTPADRWLHEVLGKALPEVRTVGTSMPKGLPRRSGLLAVVAAELRPVSVADFGAHCVRELGRFAWNVHSEGTDGAAVVEGDEGAWRVVAAPGRIADVATLARGWHEGRRDLRFTERTIGRRDFLAGVLLGSVPVNPNRIPLLAKILRGRWRTAIGIARDRRIDMSEAFMEALLARLNVADLNDGRRRLAPCRPTSKLELTVFFDRIIAVAAVARSGEEEMVFEMQLHADGVTISPRI